MIQICSRSMRRNCSTSKHVDLPVYSPTRMIHLPIMMLLAVAFLSSNSMVQAQCEGLTAAQQRHCESYSGYNTDGDFLPTQPAPPIEGPTDGSSGGDGGGSDNSNTIGSSVRSGGVSNATIISAAIGGVVLLAAAFLVRRRVAHGADDEEEEDDTNTLEPAPGVSTSTEPTSLVNKPALWPVPSEDASNSATPEISNLDNVGPTTAALAAAAYRKQEDAEEDLEDVPMDDDDEDPDEVVSSSGSSSSEDEEEGRVRVRVTKMEQV